MQVVQFDSDLTDVPLGLALAEDTSRSLDSSQQWLYLVSYLTRDLGCSACIIEREYVDRHYSDEYRSHDAGVFVRPSAALPQFRSDVHLGPFRLNIQAIPFQTQEQAVGVCATTATWIALAVTSRKYGERTPTPGSVTRAGERLYAFAESGFDVRQFQSAVKSFGYTCEEFRPASFEFFEFHELLLIHLRSETPVVLWPKTDNGDRHAVVATGFRLAAELVVERERSALDACFHSSRIYLLFDRIAPFCQATEQS
jgi:hypothetical protein